MQTILSIVVPVYNQERYLDRCLFRIEKQNNPRIEVLIVNDGSTDHSRSVIAKYTSRNKNFLSFEQENQGVSIARNTGMERAQGTYITFVDADDEVTSAYVSTILKQLQEKPDLLCFDACKVTKGRKKRILHTKNEIQILQPMEGFNGYLDRSLYDKMEGYSWNKVFRHDIIKEKHIRFDKRKKIGEDVVFCAAYCSRIRTITFINQVLYKYYIYPVSLTQGYKEYAVQDYMYFIDCFLDIAKANTYEPDPHQILAFYIGWWFSAVDDESHSKNYTKGIRKLNAFLEHPYFKAYKDRIRFPDLSLKRKIYYILIRCHCTRIVYTLLYVRNRIG